eukprot:1159467-Pelagomonas_calceolata.AAC.15
MPPQMLKHAQDLRQGWLVTPRVAMAGGGGAGAAGGIGGKEALKCWDWLKTQWTGPRHIGLGLHFRTPVGMHHLGLSRCPLESTNQRSPIPAICTPTSTPWAPTCMRPAVGAAVSKHRPMALALQQRHELPLLELLLVVRV